MTPSNNISDEEIYAAWINRTLYPIMLILIIILIRQNMKRYKAESDSNPNSFDGNSNNPRHLEQNFCHRCLKIWSLAAMTSSSINLLSSILIKIPIICNYIYAVPYISYSLITVCFVGFQTVILQYIFVSHFLIRLLFVPLFVIIFITLIIFWFIIESHDVGQYGCSLLYLSQNHSWIILIGIFVVLGTHITVLVLFVFKLYQLKDLKLEKYQKKRIRMLLQKVLYLTIIYDLKFMIIGAFGSIMSGHIPDYFHNILIGFDDLASCLIIHLMIQHNNNLFCKIKRKFINIMHIGIKNNEQKQIALKNASSENEINPIWLTIFLFIFVSKFAVFVLVLSIISLQLFQD